MGCPRPGYVHFFFYSLPHSSSKHAFHFVVVPRVRWEADKEATGVDWEEGVAHSGMRRSRRTRDRRGHPHPHSEPFVLDRPTGPARSSLASFFHCIENLVPRLLSLVISRVPFGFFFSPLNKRGAHSEPASSGRPELCARGFNSSAGRPVCARNPFSDD